MSAFDTVIPFTLGQEGGLHTDPADPGGTTNFGISQRAYPHLDIAALTVAEVEVLYRRDYWDKIGGDFLEPAFAIMVFEAAVNQGVGAAVRTFQETINALLRGHPVTVDGVMGPDTLTASQALPPYSALNDLAARRALRYALTPQVEQFGHGWYRRLFQCYTLCRQVLGGKEPA